jgi:putative ABC transport system permease protein
LHGRIFEADEYNRGPNRAVSWGYALWRQRFGGDPRGVVESFGDAQRQSLQGRRRAAERKAAFPYTEATTLSIARVFKANPRPAFNAPSHQLSVYARLKPDVTFAQARAEMDRIGKDLEAQYPQLSRGHGAHVTSLPEEITGPSSARSSC